MTPTKFRKPRTGPALLRIRLRNGWIADGATVGGYTADKLRWTETGSDGDILAVERA